MTREIFGLRLCQDMGQTAQFQVSSRTRLGKNREFQACKVSNAHALINNLESCAVLLHRCDREDYVPGR